MRRLFVLAACLLPIAGLTLAGPSDAAPVSATTTVSAATAGPALTANPAGRFHPIRSTRIFTTASAGRLASGVVRKVAVAGKYLPMNISAVEVNVTVRVPAKSGSISVFPGTAAFNGSGTISFTAGHTEQRQLTANLGTNGTLALRNNVAGSSLEAILDVLGYYVAGVPSQPGTYHPIPIQRVSTPSRVGAIKAGGSLTVPVGGQGAIPASPDGFTAVLNLTVQSPTRAGSVTVGVLDAPASAVVNFPAGATVQKMVTTLVNRFDQTISVSNQSSAALPVIIDVVGYFTAGSNLETNTFVPIPSDSKGAPTIGAGASAAVVVLPTGLSAVDSADLPANGVWAVKLDVRPQRATKPGSLAVYSAAEIYNGIASVSFQPGEVGSYQVTTLVSTDGSIVIRNNAAVPVTAAVAVTGYYTYQANSLNNVNSVATSFPSRAHFDSISCASSTFCVSTERAGLAAVFGGRSWTTPNQIPGQTSVADLACPSATQCFAVGNQIAEYDGSSWTSVFQGVPKSSTPRISCAGTGFCLASFGSRYATWNGSTWTLVADSLPFAVAELSCPTSTFCLAIDNAADYETFDGTTWAPSAAAPGTGADPVTGLSCTAATFCQAVTRLGNASTFDGTNWTAPGLLPAPRNSLLSVSCVSSTYCVALDQAGGSRTFTANGWEAARTPMNAGTPEDISCVGVGQCVAVTQQNSAYDSPQTEVVQAYSVRLDDTTWSPPSGVAVSAGLMTGLSCPTTTFCVAVTAGGMAAESDGTTWSDAVEAVHKGGLGDVACASATLCVAIGSTGTGGVSIFQSGSWTPDPQVDLGAQLTAVSCLSSGSCVVGDQSGQVLIYSGGTWSQPKSLGRTAIAALSCATDGSCTALHYDGTAQQLRDGAWTSLPATISGYETMSCASATYCMAAGQSGTAEAWNGRTWGYVPGIYHAVSCSAADHCQGITRVGLLVLWDGHYRSTAANVIGRRGQLRLSCPAPTSCFAGDGNRTVVNVVSG